LSIEIEEAVLKKACMEMIETIFLCLPNAFKGTIYRVGKLPDLIVERIASGVVGDEREKISWGLPDKSEYNPPGKPWVEYRDKPGRPLEAMSWCVGKQKSWTAEDPSIDTRSVILQLKVGVEDFQHMEPVLVRKSDLNLDMYSSLEYPRHDTGDIIWKDSEHVVVAVIKIHFRPHTIKINSHETRVIKKLSRSLGTELLSYQLRQESMKAMQGLARDRLNACNILADSLRNAITKTGLLFSLVKQEIGRLRDQWEQVLLEERNENNIKVESVSDLNITLMNLAEVNNDLREVLINAQNRFLKLSLPPEQGKRWVVMQIEDRWKEILYRYPQDNDKCKLIWQKVENIKKSLNFGQDPDIIAGYDKMSEKLKMEWVSILYQDTDRFDATFLDRLIKILGDPALNIPSRESSKKTLIQLKVLAETMNQLERNTNFLLHQVLNGNEDKSAMEGRKYLINDSESEEGSSSYQSLMF